jgi:7-cyano-7-deazaguanine synthase
MDSVTAFHFALQEHSPVKLCLGFQYGQVHAKELVAAQRVAWGKNIEYRPIRLHGLGGLSPLTMSPSDIPAHEPEHEIALTYVPGRNIIMLAYAGGLCDSYGWDKIVGGWNAVDYGGYPDCRGPFLNAMEHALCQGLRSKLLIIAPLLYKTKAEIVKMGEALRVPWAETWSCYRGGERPCGQCNSCLVRAKGFAEAGVIDPLVG